MRIIEMCPKCGHDLLDSVVAVMPPISRKDCPHCGWSWEGKPPETIRVPFGGMAPIDLETLAMATMDTAFDSDSETIAGLLSSFEYHPEQRADILKKYESILEGLL